jgi:hypothetical protein
LSADKISQNCESRFHTRSDSFLPHIARSESSGHANA